ncbi:MAG: TVP38/TMEM64 family protein [Planctomycetaceae bacterium]
MAKFRSSVLRRLLAALLAGLFVVITIGLAIPGWRAEFNGRLASWLEGTRQWGAWGPIAVGAAFVPACLFFLPGSPLTLIGGFAFGATLSGLAATVAAVSIGSTLGASLAFLAGRYLARDWVETKVSTSSRFRAIDAAVATQGWKIVLLTRLSPVFPFNLLNYAFGLTAVRFRDYVVASWIGMLPGTLMYVYLGSTARQLADVVAGRVEQNAAQQALYYFGLAATVVATVYVTRLARRALDAELPRG